jgi:hypothetical protein
MALESTASAICCMSRAQHGFFTLWAACGANTDAEIKTSGAQRAPDADSGEFRDGRIKSADSGEFLDGPKG